MTAVGALGTLRRHDHETRDLMKSRLETAVLAIEDPRTPVKDAGAVLSCGGTGVMILQ